MKIISKEKLVKVLGICMNSFYITLIIFLFTSVTVVAEDLIITSNGKRTVNESINIGKNNEEAAIGAALCSGVAVNKYSDIFNASKSFVN